MSGSSFYCQKLSLDNGGVGVGGAVHGAEIQGLSRLKRICICVEKRMFMCVCVCVCVCITHTYINSHIYILTYVYVYFPSPPPHPRKPEAAEEMRL